MTIAGFQPLDICSTTPFRWVVLPGVALATITYLFCKHVLPNRCPYSLQTTIVEVIPTSFLPKTMEGIPLAEWALFNTKYTLFRRLSPDLETDEASLKARFRTYLARKFEDGTLPLQDEALRPLIVARLRGENSEAHTKLNGTLDVIELRIDQVVATATSETQRR